MSSLGVSMEIFCGRRQEFLGDDEQQNPSIKAKTNWAKTAAERCELFEYFFVALWKVQIGKQNHEAIEYTSDHRK